MKVDLCRAQKISRALVQWEFPEKKYDCVIEGSSDGQTWQPLPGTVRFVRIQTTKLPDAKWASIREVQLFDGDGKEIKNQRLAASGTPSAAAFDDSAWRKLTVPHDWGIEGPFRDDLDGNTGKLPWKAIGWYRKHFNVPAEDSGKRLFVDFDGAMANAQVWLNGELVGGWPYGYQPFRVELTDKVKFGGENVIAVRLDTAHWGSRWYPGAGLYRNVWLVKTAPLHVAHWGVFIKTTAATDEACGAEVSMIIDNQSDKECAFDMLTSIYEMKPDGSPDLSRDLDVNLAGKDHKVLPGGSFISTLAFQKAKGRLKPWSIESPNMYVARTTLTSGGKVVDVYDQPFGFRTIEFTHDGGFKLNGKRVQLNGTCNHHDLGPLGAAFNTRAQERQLEIL
ncbi:MAG: hypothetical protein NTY53_07005, partial [Kiritimatiellaeota bacterium]|nr:hypothetical protein [Kiritimatiellota bacterium]